jgi:hypothetical protein
MNRCLAVLSTACALGALACVTPASAAVIGTFGINPTSAAGVFSNDPLGPGVGGLFVDQYTFDLIGGPVFVTVASATNTFAVGGIAGPFSIQNFAAAIFETTDAIIGNADDVLRFGPQFATLDPDGLSQSLSGTGIMFPGHYYLQIQGTAGTLAGYGGNLSVAAVAVPAPLAGAGIPGLLIAIAGLWGFARRRQLRRG